MDVVQSITVADGPANPDGDGGRGQCSLADLMDPHRSRGVAGMLAAAIRAGYLDCFHIDYPALKKAVEEMSKSDQPRIRLGALKLLTVMALHDLKMVETLAKASQPEKAATVTNVVQIFNVPPPRVLGAE